MGGKVRCPHCGKSVLLLFRLLPGSGFDAELKHGYEPVQQLDSWEPFRQYGQSVDLPDDIGEWVRERPVRPATVESDVLVPAMQAVCCGLAVALLFIVVTVVCRWPWYVPFLALAVTVGPVWVLLLADHRRLLRQVERIVGRDLDGDRRVGEQPVTLEVTTRAPMGSGMHFMSLPTGITEAMVVDFAVGVLAGASMSQANWCGQAGPFSREQFEQMLQRFEQGGLVCWRNPGAKAQGRELTPRGRVVFEGLMRTRTRTHATGG